VAAVGAATVLSFAILAEYFPKQLAGRANGALNLFHIAAAFVVQYATGVVLQHWIPQAGHYPEIAYQTAFALNLALQVVAWIWFMFPRVNSGASEALGRTRRTITHALQGVKPDAIRSGLKLWSMRRIIDAVNSNSRAPVLTGSPTTSGLQAMFDQLTATDGEMRAISSLEGRRAFARKTLLPLLHEVDQAMRRDGRANGEQEMLTDLRCDQHLRVFLVSGLGPDATNGCDWSHTRRSRLWTSLTEALSMLCQ
jgi:hypothetical protein